MFTRRRAGMAYARASAPLSPVRVHRDWRQRCRSFAIHVIYFCRWLFVAGRQGACSSLSPGGGNARSCDALFCRKSSGIWYDPAGSRPGLLASCDLCCLASSFLLECDGSARRNALLPAGDKLCMVRRPSSHRRLWPLVVWRRFRGIGPKSG